MFNIGDVNSILLMIFVWCSWRPKQIVKVVQSQFYRANNTWNMIGLFQKEKLVAAYREFYYPLCIGIIIYNPWSENVYEIQPVLWHIPIPFKKFIPFWGLSAKPYKTTWVKFSVSIRTELVQDSKPCIDMHTHAFFVCLKIQRANHSNSIHMTPHHFVIHMYPIHTYIHNKTKHNMT